MNGLFTNIRITNKAVLPLNTNLKTINGQSLINDCNDCVDIVITAGPVALSSITPAIATNTIDNLNFAQVWNWNTLAGETAFTLSSNSTGALSEQTILKVELTGANASSSVLTYAAQIINKHSGTSSTNIALYLEASGGTNNYALQSEGQVLMSLSGSPALKVENNYIVSLGDLDYAVNGTFLKVNDNLSLITMGSDSTNVYFSIDHSASNPIISLGDISNVYNGSYLAIDDANQQMDFWYTTGRGFNVTKGAGYPVAVLGDVDGVFNNVKLTVDDTVGINISEVAGFAVGIVATDINGWIYPLDVTGAGKVVLEVSPIITTPSLISPAVTVSASFTNNTLGAASLVTINSTSTAAASNLQKLLTVTLSGANATSNQATYCLDISNTHTGSNSTNIAARFTANSGTNNYALITAGGNVGIGTSTPTSLLHTNGTIATTNGAIGVLLNNTGSGTAAQQFGVQVNMQAGYTGAGIDQALSVNNYSAGTGATVFGNLVSVVANIGVIQASRGTTNGDNVGCYTWAGNGLRNVGASGNASFQQKNSASGVSVGVFGTALRANASAVHIGGLFCLFDTAPSVATSAALIADNGAQVADIFICRDNGTAVFNILDGGFVGIGTTSTTSYLSIKAGTTTVAPIKLTSGTNNTTAQGGTLEYNGSHYETPSSLLRYGKGGTIFNAFADVGNSTTVETDLHTITLVANTFRTNGEYIDSKYSGRIVGSATATRQFKVYFGGTAIFDSTALPFAAASSWEVNVTVLRVSSTVVRSTVTLSSQGTTLSVYQNYAETAGLTLSNTNILKITGTAAGVGAATNDIVLGMAKGAWFAAVA